MKIPNFEISQVALDMEGNILHSMDSFSSWIGESSRNLSGRSFYQLMTALDPSWKLVLEKKFYQKSFEKFLPISSNEAESSLGIALAYCRYESMGVLSISPALAPHESLKKAFLGDLMKDPGLSQIHSYVYKKQKAAYPTTLVTSRASFLPKGQI